MLLENSDLDRSHIALRYNSDVTAPSFMISIFWTLQHFPYKFHKAMHSFIAEQCC